MIATDFAPNETAGDALASLIILTRPWMWFDGKERDEVSRIMGDMFPGGTAIPFLSGRAALRILLASLRFPHGSEVVVQGFTCEAVSVPILESGLTPVYADIENVTYSLDFTDLLRKITGKTKAIVLQHTFGMVPAHRDRVLQLAKERNILIVEDLAHGFSPDFWHKQSLGDNQVLSLSFGRSKALSSVFGGALVTRNHDLALTLRGFEAGLPYPDAAMMTKLLCYKPLSLFIKPAYNMNPFGKILHRIATRTGLMVAEISQKEKRGAYDPYLEKKYPNALAILLLKQLNGFDRKREQRKRIATLYAKRFGIDIGPYRDIPRFPLRVKDKAGLINSLKKKNIYIGDWYSQPVAPKGVSLSSMRYRPGSCPNAEKICTEIINLPTLVSELDAQKLVGIIQEFRI
jgi:dTDP-4-amino-4,6-dideoxygalactose transaminase